MKLNGFDRIAVVLSLPAIIGMAYSYIEDAAYYNANPEDLLGGVGYLAVLWGSYFSIRWIVDGFKNK